MDAVTNTCLEQHAVFRALLEALARPGRIFCLPASALPSLSALERVAAALFDHRVGFALLGEAEADLASRIARETGARPVPAEAANFLLVPSGDSRQEVLKARCGRPEYPDEGATILYGVTALAENGVPPGPLLSGPGIRESARPGVAGLSVKEWDNLRLLNQEYPLGVDAFLVTLAGEVMGIPRSTRIQGG